LAFVKRLITDESLKVRVVPFTWNLEVVFTACIIFLLTHITVR
jgi:hypothetical protein